MMNFASPSFLLAGFVAFVTYFLAKIVYRLVLHPLAHIPGPRLAACTYLYEWYYDLVHNGAFTYELPNLHATYGPIVRINPDEVHIFDPDYFDEIFNQTTGPSEKPENLAGIFGPYPATIGTANHELHRLRRSGVNPFFSRTAVIGLVPSIMRPLDLLCGRLEEASETGEVLNMKYFYAAVTLDVMNDYCFAKHPVNVLKKDFSRKSFDDINDFLAVSFLNLHIPWLLRPTFYLPENIYKIVVPKLADTLSFRLDLSKQVEAIRDGKDQSHKDASHRTIFHELLNNGKLPPSEMARDRVRDEAFSLVTAGSGTTAMVLQVTAYHISANPAIRLRLYEELKNAIPDPDMELSLTKLEGLKYLAAVINEGLRLGDPLTHRVGRQFPNKQFTHQASGIIIPRGFAIYTTLFFTHHSADIFDDPYVFNPERWLGPQSKALEKYLVTFSKGSRACLGINLARAELFLILAKVFRKFDFDLSLVHRRRDIDYTRNQITGARDPASPGILVKVKKVE